MCGVDGSPGVVGRGNGGGGALYGVYSCCKKSLGTQLSNIFNKIGKIAYLKIVTCIIEMMYCWLRSSTASTGFTIGEAT
jgi:hypothetical protein